MKSIYHGHKVMVSSAAVSTQTIVPEAGDTSHNTNRDGVAPGIFAVEILAQCPGGDTGGILTVFCCDIQLFPLLTSYGTSWLTLNMLCNRRLADSE